MCVCEYKSQSLKNKLDTVAHIRLWKRAQENRGFEIILGYTVSSRSAWTTRAIVSKQQQNGIKRGRGRKRSFFVF